MFVNQRFVASLIESIEIYLLRISMAIWFFFPLIHVELPNGAKSNPQYILENAVQQDCFTNDFVTEFLFYETCQFKNKY